MNHTELKRLADMVADLEAFPLSWDYDLIASLGRGAIWVDLLRQEGFSHGKPLPRLSVAGWMLSALHGELGCEPAQALEEATLKIRFRTERHADQRDPHVLWAWEVPQFVTCTAHCRSRLTAAGVTAIGLGRCELEWPANYAARKTWPPAKMSLEEWQRSK